MMEYFQGTFAILMLAEPNAMDTHIEAHRALHTTEICLVIEYGKENLSTKWV